MTANENREYNVEHQDIGPYIGLVTEEYRTIRDESKQASINMWTAMQWGAALIGITIGIGLSQWNATNPASMITFSVVVPTFASLTMAFWLGEAARFKRAGDYLCLLEQKLTFVVNEAGLIPTSLGQGWPTRQSAIERALWPTRAPIRLSSTLIITDPLAWEQWLRHQRGHSAVDGHLAVLYALRLGFFLILAWGSWALGMLYAFGAWGHPGLGRKSLFTISALGILVCASATVVAIVIGRALNENAKAMPRFGPNRPSTKE